MVSVDLSSSESSDAGIVIASICSHGILKYLLIEGEYEYDLNVGLQKMGHLLHLHLKWGDLIAFMDLIDEFYSSLDDYREGIEELKEKAGMPVYK